ECDRKLDSLRLVLDGRYPGETPESCTTRKLSLDLGDSSAWRDAVRAQWSGSGDSFALSMPPAEAQRFYRLRFDTKRSLAADRLTEFEAVATKALDALIAKRPLQTESQESLDVLCTAIRSAVNAVLKPNEVLSAKSLCGPERPIADEERAIFGL